jgi:hypothetical protein
VDEQNHEFALPDPLEQLDEWGKSVEKRVGRSERRRRIVHVFRRGRRWMVASMVLLAVAGAIGAVAVWGPRLPAVEADDYRRDAPPSGVSATSGVGEADRGPFADTPAELFASGQAGLVMPVGVATGAWSAEEVTAALDKTRAALIAAHLDPRMLVDHEPSTLLGLLSAEQRTTIGAGIAAGDYAAVAARISAQFVLDEELPRVSGRTTYRAGLWGDVPALEVITNYVWVYPFEVPKGWAGSRIVGVHVEEHWYFPKDASVSARYRGMNLGAVDGYFLGSDCAEMDRGFLAPDRGDDSTPRPAPSDEDPYESYFRPDHALDIGSDCDDAAASPTPNTDGAI